MRFPFLESLGCFPRSLPFDLATAIPSRLRSRIRSASNSVTPARRSSLVTTSESPSRQAASASLSPGRAMLAPVSPRSVTVKVFSGGTPRASNAFLAGDVLVVGG